jgi:hypothetical protein
MTPRRIARLLRDLRSVFASAEALCDLHRASPAERAEFLEQQRQHINQRMTWAPSAFANIKAMARDRRSFLAREQAHALW